MRLYGGLSVLTQLVRPFYATMQWNPMRSGGLPPKARHHHSGVDLISVAAVHPKRESELSTLAGEFLGDLLISICDRKSKALLLWVEFKIQ